MIVTLGANVMTITAVMVLAMILVESFDRHYDSRQSFDRHYDRRSDHATGVIIEILELATMKTGVVATKSAATTQGTTMIAMLTDEMGAVTLMRHSVLAVAVVVVEESLVRTLWLNFPLPRFGCRN
jgi:hypothetical protein